jgi:uncharacterized protein (TIGR02145 family)
MKKTLLILLVLSGLNSISKAQTVTDFDGNSYSTVTIGSQEWMSENLKTTHFQNGNSITNITDNTEWFNLTSSAWCHYDNNISYENVYGKLYNWYTVNDNRNICPTNWHIPTEQEWNTLSVYLGGTSVAGGKLKTTGTTIWTTPNTGATNESNFYGLPSGIRNNGGNFYGIGWYGWFWSSTEYNTTSAYCFELNYNNSLTQGENNYKRDGYSVRCVKNSINGLEELNIEKSLQLYPNPTSEKFSLNNIHNQSIYMSVYNLLGDLILEQQLGNGENTFDIRNWEKGTYLIKFTGSEWTVNSKIVKI